jgi:hypothetical protein
MREPSKKKVARLYLLDASAVIALRRTMTDVSYEDLHALHGISGALLSPNNVFPLGFLITILYAFLIFSVLPRPSHHWLGHPNSIW